MNASALGWLAGLTIVATGCASVRMDAHAPVAAERPFEKTLVSCPGLAGDRRAAAESSLQSAFLDFQEATGRWVDVFPSTAAPSEAAVLARLRDAGYDSLFLLQRHSMIHWPGRETESLAAALAAPPADPSDVTAVETQGRAGEERFVNGRAQLFDDSGRRVWWAHGTARSDRALRRDRFLDQVARACVRALAADGRLPRRPKR